LEWTFARPENGRVSEFFQDEPIPSHIDYALEDELDLEPSKDRSSAYNAVTKILGFLYHDILGGNNEMQVQAHWSNDR